MSSMDPRIDMHRWYAIVYFGDEVLAVLASTPDGLVQYDSMEAYEAAQE
jgi:hypothetical protein